MSFPYRIIDLTHTLDEAIPSWNGSCGFHQEVKLDYNTTNSDISFRVQQLKMHAGIGTHIDAPAHCNLGKKTIDELSLDNLIAPCSVIDVSSSADEDYSLSAEEIELFEKSHSAITPGSFVIVRTGWDRFWREPEKYHNRYRFPSVSQKAAELLIKREVVGLGIDTLSPDRPESGYPVHAAFLGAEKYLIENIAHANLLPATGSWIMALPLKTRYGTEAPLRLVGLILI